MTPVRQASPSPPRLIARLAAGMLVMLPWLLGLALPSVADVVPNPLLWQRKYVPEVPITNEQLVQEVIAGCAQDQERGLRESGAAGGPRIAAVGDSVQSQMRAPSMFDAQIHWMYASHCGEKFGTALDSGRVGDALGSNPDALVIGLGSNNLSGNFRVNLDLLPGALADLQRLLDATDGARCRVIYTLPDVANAQAFEEEKPIWLYMTAQINTAIRSASLSRPNLHVADWAEYIASYWPAYIPDGLHLSRFGTNEKINLAIETARGCWAPDTPAHLGAIAGNATATVWWDPLPEPEGVLGYKVTASDGRSVSTSQPTVNFPGLVNGRSYEFKVQAINQSGTSSDSAWTSAVVPDAAGTRFHAISPLRVLDTRDGLGGKSTPFGPAESFTMSLAGVVPPDASAVALNVTATGQTQQTFLTVWPAGQSRPLTSNLNPQPGVVAVPAMVTSRVGVGGAVQLFNNSGQVHVVADVVGWYGTPGAATGSLYAPLTPTRVLDTRTGQGGKTTPFGPGEEHALSLEALPAGASAAVLNVTSTDTTGATHLTLWPEGASRPLASSLNPQTGLTRANLTVSKVGVGNAVRVYNNASSTAVVIDLVGYYTAEAVTGGGSEYYPMTPERGYDTRDGTGGAFGPVANTQSLSLQFAGKGALPPSEVTAVDANVTVVEPAGPGHTTIWPSGAQPLSSVLNFRSGEVVANRDAVTLADGASLAWSAAPSIQYVVDVAGWFGPRL